MFNFQNSRIIMFQTTKQKITNSVVSKAMKLTGFWFCLAEQKFLVMITQAHKAFFVVLGLNLRFSRSEVFFFVNFKFCAILLSLANYHVSGKIANFQSWKFNKTKCSTHQTPKEGSLGRAAHHRVVM